MVQTNSATAEQSAAASEELSGQAQIMKGLVQGFKLYDGEKEEKAPQSKAKTRSRDFQPEIQVYGGDQEDPVLTIDPVYFEEQSSFGGGKY